jgi:hypothetical protein
VPGAWDVLIGSRRTALQCFRSLDVPSKASCNDFVKAAWLVCMFIVVSEDILVLAIGVGLNSVIQVMLVGSIEIEQEQQ